MVTFATQKLIGSIQWRDQQFGLPVVFGSETNRKGAAKLQLSHNQNLGR